jgi:hypothetical protein
VLEELTGMAPGEVQAEVLGQPLDPATDLEQEQLPGAEFATGHATTQRPAAQGVEQAVGGGMYEEPELVGPRAMGDQVFGLADVCVVAAGCSAASPAPVWLIVPILQRRRDHWSQGSRDWSFPRA